MLGVYIYFCLVDSWEVRKMEAWNKKKKEKYTTKGRWQEVFGEYYFSIKYSKSLSITDNLFGSSKFKAYRIMQYIN